MVEVDAVPDGNFYPVKGSPIADEISYQFEKNVITGVGRKGGSLSFRETITLAEPRKLRVELYLELGAKEIPLGTAHFEKQQ